MTSGLSSQPIGLEAQQEGASQEFAGRVSSLAG